MKNLTFKDSYTIWSHKEMRTKLITKCYAVYNDPDVVRVLNRSFNSMYIEWWLHNIGYYLTLPLCQYGFFFLRLNLRFQDVDIGER